MKTQDLIPGRDYKIDHSAAKFPARPARLLRCGKGVHTFQVAVDPKAETTALQEIQVRSRYVEREWTPSDSLRSDHRERAKETEAKLNAKLKAMFGVDESVIHGRDAAFSRVHPTGNPANPLSVSLFFNSTSACEQVLKALGIALQDDLTTPQQPRLEPGD